jgi:hypothetical protein
LSVSCLLLFFGILVSPEVCVLSSAHAVTLTPKLFMMHHRACCDAGATVHFVVVRRREGGTVLSKPTNLTTVPAVEKAVAVRAAC